MSVLIILLVAVSLSMDAFSLSFAYGMMNFSSKKMLLISISVGIFHFFMPIIGIVFGRFLEGIMSFNVKLITVLVFIGLGIEMLLSVKNDKEINDLNGLLSIILFSLAVSIDSFLMGINLGINNTNIFLSPIIFMLISGLFTYIGLLLGKKINSILGNISTIIGGIILIILGLFYLK